jgi:putative membrane protein
VKFHFQQAIRALILLIFTGFIFKLHYSGEITKFINPKYEGLSQTASVIFLLLFFIQTTRIWTVGKREHHCDHCDHDHHHHDHGDTPFNTKKFISYSIIIVPLLSGLLLPPKILDASIVEKKGGFTVLANHEEDTNKLRSTHKEENNSTDDTHSTNELAEEKLMSMEEYEQTLNKLTKNSTIKIEDSFFSVFYEEINHDIDQYVGKKIELTGFVYKEDGLAEDQLILSRFLISHCVADASIIGFLTTFPEASNLDEDTWVQANGVIEMATYNGNHIPIVRVTDWKKVKEPNEPYVYPITIKVL